MFIRDALRFISAFLAPISESAPQIYLSTLPFAPKHSLVAEIFCSKFPNTLTISDGRPSQWPMIVFVAEHHKGGVECIVLSPDEKTFASISEFMHICDSETGHCILGPFQLTNLGSPFFVHTNACFSPDRKHVLVRYRQFRKSHHQCLWRLDTQQMVSFDLDVVDNHPPVIHSSHTNHVFVR